MITTSSRDSNNAPHSYAPHNLTINFHISPKHSTAILPPLLNSASLHYVLTSFLLIPNFINFFIHNCFSILPLFRLICHLTSIGKLTFILPSRLSLTLTYTCLLQLYHCPHASLSTIPIRPIPRGLNQLITETL